MRVSKFNGVLCFKAEYVCCDKYCDLTGPLLESSGRVLTTLNSPDLPE